MIELIDQLMAKKNAKTRKNINESTKQKANQRTAPKQAAQKKTAPKQTFREDKTVFSFLDDLTENAMKETLTRTIMESNASSDDKLNYISAINTKFTKEQTLSFMKDIMYPVLEATTFTTKKSISAKSKCLHLPVYEIALVLESARNGILNEDSIDANIVTNYVEDAEPVDAVEDIVEFPESLDPLSEDGSASDLVDVHQYEDNDPDAASAEPEYDERAMTPMQERKMYLARKYGKLALSEDCDDVTSEVEMDPESESDIMNYSGELAPNPDGLFDPPLTETTAGLDVEVDYDDVNDIAPFQGELGGADPDTDYTDGAGEFEGSGVLESQILIAKHCINRIFKEYGITNRKRQNALINEAVAALVEFGATMLYPSVSDISDMVIVQNNLSEVKANFPSPRAIIENTQPFTHKFVPEALKRVAMREATILKKKNLPLTKSKYIKEAYAHQVENARRAFRTRMKHFSKYAKARLNENWKFFSDKNNKKNKFLSLETYVYSQESALNNYVKNPKSPVFRPRFLKESSKSDSLVCAIIVNEMALRQKELKSKYCSQTQNCGKYVLESLIRHANKLDFITEDMTQKLKAKNTIKALSNTWMNQLKSM